MLSTKLFTCDAQGFECFLSSKDTLRKRARAYRPEDKIFSLSSKSSPAVRLIVAQALLDKVWYRLQLACCAILGSGGSI